jgi:maltose-binding protein MalE
MLCAQQAGITFAVSAVPPFGKGKSATAFTLVHGLFVTKRGVNNAIAHDLFADYLTQPSLMASLSKSIICPVAAQTAVAQDAGVEQYQQLCRAGTPMPTFPQMERVWRIVGEAQASVISGAPARVTAQRAAAGVAALFGTGRRSV